MDEKGKHECVQGSSTADPGTNRFFLFPFPGAAPLIAIHPKDHGAWWGALGRGVPPCSDSFQRQHLPPQQSFRCVRKAVSALGKMCPSASLNWDFTLDCIHCRAKEAEP